jgi:hypothetical protein
MAHVGECTVISSTNTLCEGCEMDVCYSDDCEGSSPEIMPPDARVKMFIMPKMLPKAPASTGVRRN